MKAMFKKLNSEPFFTADINTVKKGKGVYDKKEWAHTRKLSDNFFLEANELNFRICSYSELSKFNSAFNLCKNFNFSPFNKLGDIGGYPFFQASVIHDLNQHLQLVLTDYDVESCNRLKFFPRYSNFKIQNFDAKKDDNSIFNNCDILTMWGVDYALSDEDLLRLFDYIKDSKKILLLASFNINPILFNYQITKIAKFILKIIIKVFKLLLKKPTKLWRQHGIGRNENYFNKLSKQANVKIETIQVDKHYRIYKIDSGQCNNALSTF
jgi:hypothetical protein